MVLSLKTVTLSFKHDMRVRAGFGGLIRKGEIIGYSDYLGIVDNTFVELMSFYHGLKFARNLGYNYILCYSDTFLDLVSKGYCSYHCYSEVIIYRSWIEMLPSFTIREHN
jgi:hypothetical protein